MGVLLKEDTYRRFTYADYKEGDLKVGECYELIRSEAFAMAGSNTRHQTILGEIFFQL